MTMAVAQIGGLLGLGLAVGRAGLGATTGGFLSALSREATYSGNKAAVDGILPGSNLFPDLSDIMDLWTKGRVDDETLKSLVDYHGVGDWWWLWFEIMRSNRRYLDPTSIVKAWHRNFLGNATLNEWLGRNGVAPETRNLVVNPPFDWEPEQIRVLQACGELAGDDNYDNLLSAAGMSRARDQKLFKELYRVPPMEQLYEMRNRGIIGDTALRAWTIRNGYTNPQILDMLPKLRFQIHVRRQGSIRWRSRQAIRLRCGISRGL